MLVDKIKKLYLSNIELVNNIIGTVLIKGSSLFISLFTMPAYINYFSDQKVLGVWFTILAILQWILMFDLGIGNGLRNKLVPAIIKNDQITIKKYVSSSYFIIGFISIVVLVIGCIFINILNWNKLLNISEVVITSSTLRITVLIVFIGIALQFVLSLILSILYAMQKTALSNLILLISSFLILIYVSTFKTGNTQTDLILLATINILSVNIPLIIATIIIFSSKLKEARPNFKYYDKDYALSILKLGGSFFKIQIALLFINSTNEVMIMRLFGPTHVVDYQIYYKLFFLVVTLFSLITNPLWSAITKAHSNEQYNWIININKVLKIIVIIISIGNLFLLFISQSIVKIWLDNDFKINNIYALCFLMYSSITMYNTASSCIANGIGDLKCQIKCNILAAIIKIPAIIIGSLVINSWISVIIINSIIILPYGLIQQKLLKHKLLIVNRDLVKLERETTNENI